MKKLKNVSTILTFTLIFIFQSNIAFSAENKLEIEKYDTGNVKVKTEKTENDAIYKSWEYSERGFLTRHVDFFSASCGTSIGTIKTYKGGFLFSKEIYGPVLPIDSKSKQRKSCDYDYFQSLTKISYHSTGKVKSTESYKYILANFGDESVPCGAWKVFNSRGMMGKSKNFTSCAIWGL